MLTAGTPGAATRSITKFSEFASAERRVAKSETLFLREVGFRFCELWPVGAIRIH